MSKIGPLMLDVVLHKHKHAVWNMQCAYRHCRQLGSELHELHPVLPLFDGLTGQAVPQHVDNRVERLRDVLMDDARERVDDLGEDLVVGLAFFMVWQGT